MLSFRLFGVCALYVAVSAFPSLAQDAPLSAARVPLRARTPRDFVPRGWKIEKRVGGDLNRDKVPDAALVLVENEPADADGSNRQRALVVLLQQGKSWRCGGFNNSLLLGTHDGGQVHFGEETPVDVSIARGILVVDQDSGARSREVIETTHKFRFDRRTKRFYLIGLEQNVGDRSRDPIAERVESSNFLTGAQTITLIGGEDDLETHRTRRASRKLRTLESVNGNEQ